MDLSFNYTMGNSHLSDDEFFDLMMELRDEMFPETEQNVSVESTDKVSNLDAFRLGFENVFTKSTAKSGFTHYGRKVFNLLKFRDFRMDSYVNDLLSLDVDSMKSMTSGGVKSNLTPEFAMYYTKLMKVMFGEPFSNADKAQINQIFSDSIFKVPTNAKMMALLMLMPFGIGVILMILFILCQNKIARDVKYKIVARFEPYLKRFAQQLTSEFHNSPSDRLEDGVRALHTAIGKLVEFKHGSSSILSIEDKRAVMNQITDPGFHKALENLKGTKFKLVFDMMKQAVRISHVSYTYGGYAEGMIGLATNESSGVLQMCDNLSDAYIEILQATSKVVGELRKF